MEKIKVLAFDDSPARRESLQLLVESADDMEWSGAFENCEGVDEIVMALRPDVVLMDIQMPKSDGIEGLKIIRKVSPQTLVVMQTVFEDDEKVFTCLQNGAAGYLLKKAPPEKIIEGIRDVYYGGAPITPSIAARILDYFKKPEVEKKPQDYGLTDREKEILGYLVKGLSYKMIAGELDLSFHTVNNHVRKVYEKLQVHSQSEAVGKTLRENLLTIAVLFGLAGL
ncbi:MAG: response regulator transcription factor [Flavobacteriales bacterium]|nr:response regulator transcription factor [Flavobacteriales bacterium]